MQTSLVAKVIMERKIIVSVEHFQQFHYAFTPAADIKHLNKILYKNIFSF